MVWARGILKINYNNLFNTFERQGCHTHRHMVHILKNLHILQHMCTIYTVMEKSVNIKINLSTNTYIFGTTTVRYFTLRSLQVDL